MVRTIRTFFLSLTILAFLLFSTVGTITAYADDGSGTDATATETTTTTEEEQPSEPAVDEQAPAVDEEPPAEETPPAEDTPPVVEEEQPAQDSAVEPAISEPVVVETILEQVPDNTTLTVLNSEGEALPLASQESAETIATDYDPIWCPDGQAPIPGANGCTETFGSFDELLTFLQANEGNAAYQQTGTIFIQQGDYLGGESEINFNNYNFNNFNQNDLTLQGGWDPSSNPATPTYTTTNFNVPITIGSSTNPWIGSLTINNITIDGVSDQTGLTLHTEDVVNLNNVEVTNSQAGIDLNAGKEISLQNVNASNNETYGARIKGDKVAIDTANFSNNGSGLNSNPTGSGLEVNSINDVALINVTANNNQLFGANIVSSSVVAVEHSTFSGNLVYSYTGQDTGYGLRIVTTGTIAVDDVTADNNNQYGASLEGGNIAVENSSFTANGSGVITDPTGYGLKIVSTGEVQVLSVTANDNQFFGADVKAVQDVTVQNSFFSGHQTVTNKWTLNATFYGYGLTVVTDGDISVGSVLQPGVTANQNNLWGASLTGNDVTVYNSQFNNNVSDTETFIDDTGLIVNAAGTVDIWKVEAKENRLLGATVTSGGDVFIAESTFTGNRGFTCLNLGCPENLLIYHGIGLQVNTPGYIEVTDTNVDDNRLAGAELNGGVVTVVNSTFNNSDMGNGLIITATDTVTLTNVTASNNQGNGVDATGASCDQTVQVNGGTFSDNALFGLSVLNATLSHDGTQVFVNNGSGDFFASPCVVVIATPGNQPVSPAVTTNSNPALESTGAGVRSISSTTPVNTSSKSSSTVIGTTITMAGNQIISPTISENLNWSSRYIVLETIKMLTGYDIGFLFWENYRTMWESFLLSEL